MEGKTYFAILLFLVVFFNHRTTAEIPFGESCDPEKGGSCSSDKCHSPSDAFCSESDVKCSCRCDRSKTCDQIKCPVVEGRPNLNARCMSGGCICHP